MDNDKGTRNGYMRHVVNEFRDWKHRAPYRIRVLSKCCNTLTSSVACVCGLSILVLSFNFVTMSWNWMSRTGDLMDS